jgi:dihydrolipoamide dehydrogenase
MKPERQVDVAILGAGTAGLSASSEVRKVTDKFVVINGGAEGTTCARVGCMPSKVLIQVANDFHRRSVFTQEGISGDEHLRVDHHKVLQYVRSLRDSFVKGVLKTNEELGERMIHGYARFHEPTVLEVERQIIRAKRVIIATGSTPLIPKDWRDFSTHILTTDTLFEQQKLPTDMAVVGLGAVGVEMSQALARLGIHITGIDRGEHLAGLTDPEVNAYVHPLLAQEFALHMGTAAQVAATDGQLRVQIANTTLHPEKILASLGRSPNIGALQLERLGVPLNKEGLPPHDPTTMQVANLPVFIAGDVDRTRAVLHEAADEGRIAGFNSVQEHPHCFQRRTPLAIVFCEPNIAVVGQSFASVKDRDIAIGEARFDNQGRATVMAEPRGILRVYGDPANGRVLGAELAAPAGEHLAHLLAWAMQKEMTVFDMLQLPVYHPVVEEGMRTALRTLSQQIRVRRPTSELALCESAAVGTLN